MCGVRDYYEVLGVRRKATEREIKQAFRRLAREFHPDVTGDDPVATERFKEITEAYECLSDAQKRRRYDLFGAPGDDGGSLFDGFADVSGAVDAIRDLFRRGEEDPVPGEDLEIDVDVPFRTAFEGGKVPLVLTPRGGKAQTLTITVPPGVDNGSRLRLREKGMAGKKGGPPGDLFVRVEVEDDPRFFRDKKDLYVEVKVPLKDALVGGRVEVPLPDGSLTMTVPPGTQGGQVFRLAEKGFVVLGKKERGDLFVTVQLRVPKKVGAKAHALIQQLDELLGGF